MDKDNMYFKMVPTCKHTQYLIKYLEEAGSSIAMETTMRGSLNKTKPMDKVTINKIILFTKVNFLIIDLTARERRKDNRFNTVGYMRTV